MPAVVTTYVGREQIFTVAGSAGNGMLANIGASTTLTATPNIAAGTPVAFFLEHEGNSRLFYTDDLVGSGQTASQALPAVQDLQVQLDPQGMASGRIELTLAMPPGDPDAANPQTIYLSSRNTVIGVVSESADL